MATLIAKQIQHTYTSRYETQATLNTLYNIMTEPRREGSLVRYYCTAGNGMEHFLIDEVKKKLAAEDVSFSFNQRSQQLFKNPCAIKFSFREFGRQRCDRRPFILYMCLNPFKKKIKLACYVNNVHILQLSFSIRRIRALSSSKVVMIKVPVFSNIAVWLITHFLTKLTFHLLSSNDTQLSLL